MGDLVVSDPKVMRALAHPVRLAALSYLQRYGPATATQLADHVDASPSVISWHLRHLASFGLVDDAEPEEGRDRRQRWWKARARGWAVEMGEDPESQAAGRMLRDELLATAQAQVGQWLTNIEPELEPQWHRLAGVANTRVMLTPSELESLQEKMTALLAEYVHRDASQIPAEARLVRVLRHHLPDGPA
jgi:DNA-binding transcriptional ArsR family regulator